MSESIKPEDAEEQENRILKIIANYYGKDLPRLKDMCGAVSPERVLEDIVTRFWEWNSAPRWCHGHGAPHIWEDVTVYQSFEKECERHSDRRVKTDRRKP